MPIVFINIFILYMFIQDIHLIDLLNKINLDIIDQNLVLNKSIQLFEKKTIIAHHLTPHLHLLLIRNNESFILYMRDSNVKLTHFPFLFQWCIISSDKI